jgi:hypothetical protein
VSLLAIECRLSLTIDLLNLASGKDANRDRISSYFVAKQTTESPLLSDVRGTAIESIEQESDSESDDLSLGG